MKPTPKKRGPRPPWRVGWSDDKRRFYFHTPGAGGIRVTFSGPRSAVRNQLRKLLPVYLDVAVQNVSDQTEFIAAIRHELAALGIESAS